MKNKILTGICTAIFLIGIAGCVWVLLAPHGTQVNIVQDGVVLYSFNLAEAQDQTIEVLYNGRTNTVQIENGKIRVLEADCPDKTCVHMGWLESEKMPIVCLPNRLIIEYVSDDGGVDGVAR